ncbi:MAG: hypothetical protein VX278_03370 [Myxococcota bacterium]|nr:hypothetical protein [Myxococcota bacterium]
MKLEFGTDGIRGRAGHAPLTPEVIERLGFAAIQSISKQRPKVIVANDTRESSSWIYQALSQGMKEAGADVLYAGVMPTAAVSCATVAEEADLGIMITASHNPWYDNGLKFLDSTGKKLDKTKHRAIIVAFEAPATSKEPGTITESKALIEHWKKELPKPDLTGQTLLVDCANGAAAFCATEILSSLGAKVIQRGCEPNGRNINENVGALHPPKELKGASLGICFDGDADRIALVSPTGLLDGDDILWMFKDTVQGPLIGTVMSNGGLEEALAGRLLRSAVGDSNVEIQMSVQNARIGAEPSGHVLFSDGLPTGDGLYTALRLIQAVGLPLPSGGWTRWPIAKENIRYEGERIDLSSLNEIDEARRSKQRVIVRYSGTEPVLRILVEGLDAEHHLQKISTAFRERSK